MVPNATSDGKRPTDRVAPPLAEHTQAGAALDSHIDRTAYAPNAYAPNRGKTRKHKRKQEGLRVALTGFWHTPRLAKIKFVPTLIPIKPVALTAYLLSQHTQTTPSNARDPSTHASFSREIFTRPDSDFDAGEVFSLQPQPPNTN